MRRLRRSTRLLSGIGLHTGIHVEAFVQPASPDCGGVVFRRTDSGQTRIPATLEAVSGSSRRTVLSHDGVSISTVEHVLAALAGCGVVSAEVCLDGPELPALDGSAAPWVEVIQQAGFSPIGQLDRPGCWTVVRSWHKSFPSGGFLTVRPCGGCRIDCSIDFEHPSIGVQRYVFDGPDPESFCRDIAPARTFGLLSEAGMLTRSGLAQGASLESAVVFGPQGPLNREGLRFPDEPVRHKVLDVIGDMALLGAPLAGHFVVHRCGHRWLVTALQEAVAAGVMALREAPC